MKTNNDMTLEHLNRDAGRHNLDRVLAKMPALDRQHALVRLEKVLAAGKADVKTGDALEILKENASSTSLKLIWFFVYRSAHVWAYSPLTESTNAFKDLVWLRGKLLMTGLPPHPASHPSDDQSSDAMATTAQTDPARDGVTTVYQMSVGRTPSNEEIDIWKNNFSNGLTFAEFLQAMSNSPEAADRTKSKALLPVATDGMFIQLVYETVLGRGCTPGEIASWEKQLVSGHIDRGALLQSIFNDHAKAESENTGPLKTQLHDALSCQVMGTGQHLSSVEWLQTEQALKQVPATTNAKSTIQARFYIQQAPKPLVSAIASLYCGGKYIEKFMENITSQTCFKDYCELVIVDADSPEHESEVIARYCKKFKNIVYHRVNYRIGIYDAWNVGVKMARGAYCTNTNLDDLRRRDSLELQAATLDNLPFVDVVYQDFYYTFDPNLSVEEIARFGYVSDLPVINASNMMYFNSPHNAPMWRKKLHDELGYFDTYYKSAGDYEFWMRCLAAGKVFYKTNDPHVVYYQNPEGLSTRPDSRGVEEAKHILKKYGRKLVSKNLTMPQSRFFEEVLGGSLHVPPETNRYMATQRALRALSIRNRQAQTQSHR
jgi:glycosyltransferase involved in cell wall biosynthesis